MLKLLIACTARPLVTEERTVSKELDVTTNQRHHLRMSGKNYGSRDTYQNCNQEGHGGISLHFPSTAVSDTELRTLPDPAFPLKDCTLPDFPMSPNWEDIAPGRSAAQALQNEQDLSRDSHVTDNSCNHRSFTLRSIRKSSNTQNLVLTVPRSPSSRIACQDLILLPLGNDLTTSSTWPCLAAPALSAQVGVYIDDRGKSDIELLRQSAPISMFHHKEVFMHSELELPLGQNRTPDDSAVAFSSSPATKAAASPAGATSKLKVNMLIPVAEEEASKPPKDSLAWAILPRKKGEPRLSPNIVRGFEVKESGMRSATSLPVGAARDASPCLGSPSGLHTQEAGPAKMMPRFHSHQSGFWSVMSSLASLPAVERLHHASTSSIPGGAGNKALMRRSEHHIK
ncbi:hypothetical protein CEUSTIGMA_g7568.t1 [Chlamydomonas eustigma]|uniref:Uncharacterized protein n=1 Tax=Chlamydomonas eustigma TaxID=1157962 RepID=A0A250XBI4_9CHLO|nr:hypothetical protein CEUSTIGMA_g7568.t1 [Chlamydomonas eustigma]|eukprot:GAX80130.1 hypothetical protein CEUSTIGMA_g7568.t1 [Chlamydomonas eustigma]